jgi:glycosyltransferase involved in cell wall biosynthesis
VENRSDPGSFAPPQRCLKIDDLPSPPDSRGGWPWSLTDVDDEGVIRETDDWPRISIVTPSFNQGRFLEATIRSVLLQGYPDLEYIVMDGGSDDGSVEIIRRYEDWISDWVSRPDRGQGDAVNQGWARATGEILGWLNSDDLYLPGALWRVAREFRDDPALQVLGGETEYIDADGVSTGAKKAWSFDPRTILLSSAPAQPSTFYRRNALEEVGVLDAKLHNCMDRELALRLGDRFFPKRARSIPHRLSASRIWSVTKSLTGAWPAVQERLQMIDGFLSSSRTITDRRRVRRLAHAREYHKQALREIEQGRRWRARACLVRKFACTRDPRDLFRPPIRPPG